MADTSLSLFQLIDRLSLILKLYLDKKHTTVNVKLFLNIAE
ncbi:hypothetical protein C427_5200 [Paraglaciecola psychrophila 170]|uniref:Uncharacterized protein n=1 Tax=Paraglaciecola psychrophila 170 TaxID=1129794 RepID=M4S9F1_9ALTE|nr:hypothetical protein C427_5200 [Paraglaciecola psychrophila 170]